MSFKLLSFPKFNKEKEPAIVLLFGLPDTSEQLVNSCVFGDFLSDAQTG